MLHRFMYVSKSVSEFDALDPMLLDIISEAVHFNALEEITGVLYYGNGFFIQCVEGDKDKIEALFYQKIIKDQRHRHCEILYAEDVEHRLFQHWSMKFAPLNKNIRDFFQTNYLDEFNPYLLTDQCTRPFIQVLAQEPNYGA